MEASFDFNSDMSTTALPRENINRRLSNRREEEMLGYIACLRFLSILMRHDPAQRKQ